MDKREIGHPYFCNNSLCGVPWKSRAVGEVSCGTWNSITELEKYVVAKNTRQGSFLRVSCIHRYYGSELLRMHIKTAFRANCRLSNSSEVCDPMATTDRTSHLRRCTGLTAVTGSEFAYCKKNSTQSCFIRTLSRRNRKITGVLLWVRVWAGGT